MKIDRLLKTVLLASVSLSAVLMPATAQTYEERQKAEHLQRLEAARQQDVGFASTCLMTSTILSEARSAIIADVVGTEAPQQAGLQRAFWSDYLDRLGLGGGGVDPGKVDQFVEAINENLPGPASMLKQPWQQCSQAYAYLTADACDAETRPEVSFALPTGDLGMIKICREIAQSKAEWVAAQWVLDDPEQLAEYKAAREADRKERKFFDTLLAAQPAPQCPKNTGLFIAASFTEQRKMVDQAYSEWRAAKDTEDMIANSQRPYVQWQLACDKFKLVTGYSEE